MSTRPYPHFLGLLFIFAYVFATLLYAPPAALAAQQPTQLNGSISGFVTSDSSTGEPLGCQIMSLIPEPTVDLGAGLGMPIFTTSDINGFYQFDNLPNSGQSYLLRYEEVFEIVFDPDSVPDGETTVLLDATTPSAENQNFGVFYLEFQAHPAVGDTLFIDSDGSGDGVVGLGDIPLTNVTIELTPPSNVDLGNGNGASITDTTDANGLYLFELLPATRGCVVPLPATFEVAVDTTTLPPHVNPIPNFDRDGIFDAVTTTTLNAIDNFNDLDVDFSFQPFNGSISGLTFRDGQDGTGPYDPSEDDLLRCSLVSLTPEADIDLGAGNGMPITTYSDENGAYRFDNLPTDSRTYGVTFESVSEGYGGGNIVSTTHEPADSMPPSSLDGQATLLLDASQPQLVNQDFGNAYIFVDWLVEISGYVWGDDDASGGSSQTALDIPFRNVSVSLDRGGSPVTVQTDAFGYYSFGFFYQPSLPPASNCDAPPGETVTIFVDSSTIPSGYDSNPNYDPENDGDTTASVYFDISTSNPPDQNFSFLPLTPTSVEMIDQESVASNAYILLVSVMVSVVGLGLVSVFIVKRD